MGDRTGPGSLPAIFAKAGLQLIPHVGTPLATLFEGLADRRADRANQMVESFTEDDWAQLLGALETSEQLEATFTRAVVESMQTSVAAKRRSLGRVCLAAAYDDALIDESTLIVGVLTVLEAPHIAALSAIYRADMAARERGEVLQRAEYTEREINNSIHETGRRFPPMVLGVLAGQGLIEGPDSGSPWPHVLGVTDFGELVVEHLLAAGLEGV